MKIRIISVGKMKESYWKQAQQEYCKMLSRFCTVEIVEVADEKTPENASEGEIRSILKREGERVFAALKGCDRIYALASEGRQEDSLGVFQAYSAGKRQRPLPRLSHRRFLWVGR